MKLHTNLKWDKIFELIEKETSLKFSLDLGYIWIFDKVKKEWNFYDEEFENVNNSRKTKQYFIEHVFKYNEIDER